MKILTEQRCFIGEGPVWNDKEKILCFTNGGGREICCYDILKERLSVRKLPFDVAAIAYDTENRMIVSHKDGVHILNPDNSLSPIYDDSVYKIRYANDMKVGPDGAIYVGTQSGKRIGVSDKIDGKLYRIAPDGNVTVLLDGLILSNGMDWSVDETKYYHTDSDTGLIREYDFDKLSGSISFTGRALFVKGVDGFTVDSADKLFVGCWGQGHVAVVDTKMMETVDYIPVPCKIPASCGFCGENMDILAITTASYKEDVSEDVYAGYTLLHKPEAYGRKPYLFGALR